MIVFLGSCSKSTTDEFTIAAAANMQFAIKALAEKFEQKTRLKSEVILGSSGKLTAQIVAGAPYDIFVSADLTYPNDLHSRGLTAEAPLIYAFGKLVVWSSSENAEFSGTDLSYLKGAEHIAMANPRTAPYGKAAEQALNSVGLYESLKSKLVFGESIAQVNQFISSESAEYGFTALSVVLAPGAATSGNWAVIDSTLYSPIAQAAVLLKNRDSQTAEARQFYDFLFSAEAREILDKFGYTAPPL